MLRVLVKPKQTRNARVNICQQRLLSSDCSRTPVRSFHVLSCEREFDRSSLDRSFLEFVSEMKYLSFILALSVFASALPQNTIVDPIRLPVKPTTKSQSNNATRIVYPSEDTNKNRRPTHVNWKRNSEEKSRLLSRLVFD